MQRHSLSLLRSLAVTAQPRDQNRGKAMLSPLSDRLRAVTEATKEGHGARVDLDRDCTSWPTIYTYPQW